MKKQFFFIVLLVGVMILQACKNNQAFIVQDLEGKWNIVAVKNEPIQMEMAPFLAVNMAEGKIHGNTGCNVLNAGIELLSSDVTAFKFIRPVSTMRACPDLDTEAKILKAIAEVTHVKAGESTGQVLLLNKEGSAMLTLEKTK